MEIVVVLANIRSTYNVGAILRTAEGLGVKRVICAGYTPCPGVESGRLPHVVDKERAAIHKTALGAEELVEVEYADNLLAQLEQLRRQDYRLVGLENNLDDDRLVDLNTPGLKERLGEKIVLVLGEEVSGIETEVLEKMDTLVRIPMLGKKESFNVSVAAGMAMYQLTIGP